MRAAGLPIRILFLLVSTSVSWAAANPPRVPVSQWFEQPEVHLPGWNVQVSEPVLSFPLRWAVSIRGIANVHRAKLEGHDLHFFVKVADRSGQWFPERRYSSIEKLQKGTDITVTERFFAKPGDYQVALAIYDSTTGTHGIWKRPLHVPELDVPVSYPEAQAIQFIDPEVPFKPGSTPVLSPLENKKTMRVDVVLNLTERSDLEVETHTAPPPIRSRRGGWGVFTVSPEWQMDRSRQDFVTETLLSIADTLSSLNVNGCKRVSVVDAVRGKVFVDRRSTLDPRLILDDIRDRRATHKIDAHVLALRQQAGAFLHNYLQTVISENAECDARTFPAERVIVLVSDALVFPESKQLTPVSAPAVAEPETKFYFFRMNIYEYVQRIGMGRASTAAIPPDDQVGRLLSNLDVKRFDLANPKDFQKALSKFLDALKQ